MKVLFPKNIKKGLLSGMSFNIGPLNIGIIQLVLIAMGAGVSLVIFNSFAKSGSKGLGILFSIFTFLIFIVIAFFKISELGLIAFISKMIRNNFFDVKKKYQNNFTKNNTTEILIKETKEKAKKGEVLIQEKKRTFDREKIDTIEKGGFI